MSYRPFRNFGRFLLAACAVSLGVTSLSAQSAPSTTAPMGVNPSRVDVFLGYSYFGAHGQVKPSYLNYSSVDEGAAGSGAYYFSKYVGFEMVGMSHPNGQNDQDFSISAGPIFRAPMQNFTLFAHGLVGGGKLGGPNSDVPATQEHEPSQWGPTLAVGGGMDYDLPFFNHKFGIRLFEADYRYIHADFGPSTTVPTGGVLGGRANLSAAELSTGLLMHFGHIIPPPPIMYACSLTAPTGPAYPGDPITITGTTTSANPKKTVVYSWTSDAAGVSGTTNVLTIDTKALAAGSYTAKGHVSEGSKPGEFADCSVPFTITPFAPPTIGCSANPSTVNPGDSSTITANGLSPQNRPLTYSYSATSGSISGNTSTATLTTTGVAPGVITVTCNAVDDKGQTASQQTTVTVASPTVAPPSPQVSSLCTITFGNKPGQPEDRVDNEAKACLDDIALNAQRDPNAKLAIIGTETKEEMGRHGTEHHAAQRAVNTKEYLVTDKGIDASRIMVFTGTDDAKSAETKLIPVGATPDMSMDTPVDESMVKPQVRRPLGAPMKKHHHKK